MASATARKHAEDRAPAQADRQGVFKWRQEATDGTWIYHRLRGQGSSPVG